MKIKSLVVLGALVGAGAFIAKRWNHLEEIDKENHEKKLITLTNVNDNEEDHTIENKEADDVQVQSSQKYQRLSEDFIDAMMTQKDLFNSEYQSGSLIRVYHQISFPNMNVVDYFLKEMNEHNYEFDVNVESSVVKLAKNMVVENDMILNDIFYVADVALEYDGDYEGYSIEVL